MKEFRDLTEIETSVILNIMGRQLDECRIKPLVSTHIVDKALDGYVRRNGGMFKNVKLWQLFRNTWKRLAGMITTKKTPVVDNSKYLGVYVHLFNKELHVLDLQISETEEKLLFVLANELPGLDGDGDIFWIRQDLEDSSLPLKVLYL